MVTQLRPRTLVGWDDAGSTWSLVVDGRQSHSGGLTLDDSRALHQRLESVDLAIVPPETW